MIIIIIIKRSKQSLMMWHACSNIVSYARMTCAGCNDSESDSDSDSESLQLPQGRKAWHGDCLFRRDARWDGFCVV
jgi:hypothetical protein